MPTEQDVHRYLEPEENLLAVFFSREVGYFYVPHQSPVHEDEGIVAFTSHRILILQKHKGGGILGGAAREEVYSVPISNLNAVEMVVFEGRESAWVTLVMAAGFCCRFGVRGSNVDNAQHLLARLMMSTRSIQPDNGGAMTAIRFHEQRKKQAAIE